MPKAWHSTRIDMRIELVAEQAITIRSLLTHVPFVETRRKTTIVLLGADPDRENLLAH